MTQQSGNGDRTDPTESRTKAGLPIADLVRRVKARLPKVVYDRLPRICSATFSHLLSACVVLTRKRASGGLYPAIAPLQSSSKMAPPNAAGSLLWV